MHDYLDEGIYPEGYKTQNKLVLRKKAKYFVILEGSLYYVGGKDQQRKTCYLRKYSCM